MIYEKPAFIPYVNTHGKSIQLLKDKEYALNFKLKKSSIKFLEEDIYQINLRLDMAFSKIKN